MAAAFELEDSIEDKARDWRTRVRDAVAVGESPPDKDFNMDVERAQVEVAVEDSEQERDRLSLIVVAALSECRARRGELEDVVLGVELAGALRAGLSGSMWRIKHELEQQRAALDEPSIVNLDDPTSEPLSRPEPKEVVNANV